MTSSEAHSKSSPSHPLTALPWLAMLILAGLFTLATHWPSLATQALPFDEAPRLAELPFLVESPATALKTWGAQAVHPEAGTPYQPLATLSFAADRLLGSTGDSFAASRALNLSLHLANMCLVAGLLFILFGHRGLACLAALLFAVHPLTVEPLALLTGRAALLGASFGLGALICLVRAEPGRSRLWLPAAALLYLFAIFSQPTWLPLPLAFLVVRAWPLRRRGSKDGLTALILLLPGALLGWALYHRSGGFPAVEPVAGSHWVGAGVRAIYLSMAGLFRCLWPTDLSPFYATPTPWSLTTPAVLAALMAFVALSLLTLFAARKGYPALLAGWLLFLLFTLPSIFTHVAGDLLFADEQLYAALPALLFVVVAFLAPLWKKPVPALLPTSRQVLLTIGTLYLAGFSARQTQAYARQWSSPIRLQNYMLSLSPYAERLRAQTVAGAVRPLISPERAIEQLSATVARNPNDVESLNRLAALLIGQGRAQEAVGYLEVALANGLRDSRLYYNLGRARTALGQYERALQPLEQAIELDPTSPDPHLTLGNVYRSMNRTDEAVAAYKQVIAINPNLVIPHRFLAFTLANAGKWEEAVGAYQEVLRLEPDDADTHANLGILLNRMLRREEAQGHLRRAVELNPTDVKALYALGYSLEQSGQVEESIQWFEEALRLDPTHENAKRRLAIATKKLERQRKEEAEQADGTNQAPGKVTLNFTDAPLTTILPLFQDLGQVTYVMEDGLDLSLTLQSEAPLTIEEAEQQLIDALAEQNVVIRPGDGGTNYIERAP